MKKENKNGKKPIEIEAGAAEMLKRQSNMIENLAQQRKQNVIMLGKGMGIDFKDYMFDFETNTWMPTPETE